MPRLQHGTEERRLLTWARTRSQDWEHGVESDDLEGRLTYELPDRAPPRF